MIVDLLVESAAKRGRSVAVADARVSLTYKRLLLLARVMRDVIASETNAQNVGVMLPASAAFSGCLFGGLWASRKVVPLNFLLSAPELSKIVAAAGVDLILSVKPLSQAATQPPARTLYLEDLPIKRKMAGAMFHRTPAIPEASPDETAVILFTSGTSAEPKGVELTYNNLVSNSRDCIATAGIDADNRFLNCLPPFHVFGLTANVLVPVALGASVYCIPRFSPVAAAKAIEDHDISIFMAIPSMYAAIGRLKSVPADLMRNMYLLLSGGEPLPGAVSAGFRERFGVDILQGYGLTETSPVCTLETPHARKAGSVGKPIRNVHVKIVDAGGAELPVGQDGEVCIQGPNVMKGYYQDSHETSRVITPDGWFQTGDWGAIDPDGFLTLTGRLKEMLIIGGENVFPREVEAALEEHPAVAEAAVIGMPDANRGEVAVAFIVCHEGQSASEIELRDYVRSRLAGFKVPRQVRFESDLPRGPTGKVLKRRLVDLL